MANNTVLFRCDASQHIGVGHVMRCLSLAQQVYQLGMECVFLTNSGGEDVLNHHSSFPIHIIQYSSEYSETNQIITSKANYVVWDSYEISVSEVTTFAEQIPLLILDDTYLLPYYSCDAVLNQNLYADSLYYKHDPHTTILAGNRYTLLRPSFFEFAKKERPISRNGSSRLLLSFGGSDPDDLTSLLTGWLSKLDIPIHFDIVMGAHYAFKIKLIDRISGLTRNHHTYTLHENIRNMAEIMLKQDLVICAGGSTLYELACLGIPSCCIVTADNQLELSNAAERFNFSVNLGCIEKLDPENVNRIVTNVLIDKDRRIQMSEAGKSLIDGMGAYRVASYILNKIERKGGA